MSCKAYPVTHRTDECNDYAVKLNGETAELNSARVSTVPFNRPWPGHQRQKSQSELVNFVSYEADEAVTFEITPKEPFESVIIRPLSLGIKPEISNGTIRFTLEKPGFVTVEPYGIIKALHIFGNPVSSYGIDKDDENVIYFGKGEHDTGVIELKSNQTLFIDEGAVVHGCVHAIDADNIKIFGRGILDNSKIHENITCDENEAESTFAVFNETRLHTISLEYCTNIEIEGITIREALHYNIKPFACENLHISNIKIIGSWRYNTDGIDLNNCKNVLIEDSFFRTFDDAIATKGMDFVYGGSEIAINPENRTVRFGTPEDIQKMSHRNGKAFDTSCHIHARRCTIWNDYSGSLVVGAETNAEEMYDILYEDCDIIHGNCSAMDCHNVDYAHIHDVVYRNINVEYDDVVLVPKRQDSDEHVYENTDPEWTPYLICVRTVCHQNYSHGTRRGKTDNITFQNIRMFGKHLPKIQLCGYDEEHKSKNILIENLYLNGKRITDLGECIIERRDFVENFELK